MLLRHGMRGKWTIAPMIGSVWDVVTLTSVKLSSAVVRVDVTVPALPEDGACITGGGSGTRSSPCTCDSGGNAEGRLRPGKTAKTCRGEQTSPTLPCHCPGWWSCEEMEFECSSDVLLLPVCPREWLCAKRLDAPVEPKGL